ncbi:MAG: periplasmic heavy metal sensor [Rubellimicrobium sp.]|nr:periplasmic heavy metal sensor [Rubellimicrobium sp.]
MTTGTPKSPRKSRALRNGVIAVAVLGVIGTAGMVTAQGMGMRMGFDPFGGSMMARMMDAADATDAQAAEIGTIIEATRGDILPLIEAMPERRAQVMELLGAETLDRDAFEALRQEMLATADRASARAMEGFLDAAEVLTPEQRAAVIADGERMRSRMEQWRGSRDGHGWRGHHDGHGPRHDRTPDRG